MKQSSLKNYAKVPTVLQMEATECGAACLSMILASYRSFITLEEMRLECGVSRDGSKASNIIKAGRKFGLASKGLRVETEELKTIHVPAILHWNFNHFIVLEGFKGDRVYINDPAAGRCKISYEELDMAFTGIVLTFEKSPEYQCVGKEAKTYKALGKRLAGSEWTLFYVLLVGLFLVIPGLVIPSFSKIFLDDILIGGKTEWMRALAWGMIITIVLQVTLKYMQGHFLLKMRTKIAITSSGKFLWHVLRLPISFFSQRYAGDISQRMQSNDDVSEFLSGQLASTVINCVMLVFYLALMACYSVKLTILSLLLALIDIGYLQYISKRRADQNSKIQQDEGKMMGTAMGGLQIIETLKASGSEGDFFSKIMGYHAKNVQQKQVYGVSTECLNTLPVFITALTDALILILGGLEVMDGLMTIGTLIAFRTLAQSFMEPVTSLMQIGTQYQEMQANINRLDDVLKYKQDIAFEKEPEGDSERENHKKLDGYITIEDLAFGYSILEPPLIEKFSLTLTPGKRVALVGGSGSGKSTVGKLISGLYRPWSGKIYFDGVLQEEVPRTVLSNSVAIVDQEISMFSDTIRNNLTLWDETVDESELIAATMDAEIYDAITEKPKGFDYVLQEGGSNFSGGQRQRLEIARALTTNPTVLILDEATSALDPITEKIIDDNIRRRGCTCIVVAHRLSTIRDCDEIIVLEHGKIVQRGTHGELSSVEGHYAELIKTI